MQENQTIVYLLQETLDRNDWTKDHRDGFKVFHHTNSIKQSKTSMAIILSPRHSKAWRTAGDLEPLQTPKWKSEGRCMGLCFQFTALNVQSYPIKNENTRIVVVLVYHPYNKTYSKFNSVLDDLHQNIPSNEGMIMWGDIKATAETSDCKELSNVLGLYGLGKTNEKGSVQLQH